VFRPDAVTVALESDDAVLPLQRVGNSDFFEWTGAGAPPAPCMLRIATRDGVRRLHDPYGFPPEAPEFDLYSVSPKATLSQSYRCLARMHGDARRA
jgi:hypothetical protein